MLKKTTAIILIMILTLSISSPAYAALPDESQTTPRSIEEILNDHHAKIFELENQPAANTYSRSTVTEESITQDTISELQSAGYEAYNVTASNYDTLEAELQTNFASMGLDSDGSYIVIISGEDQPDDSGVAPADALLPPHTEGGGSSFTYSYNGVTYTMRYVTVTYETNEDYMSVTSRSNSPDQLWAAITARNIFSTTVVALVDASFPKLPIGTIASMLCVPESTTQTSLSAEELTLFARTNWTCDFIQVWDSTNEIWVSCQLSEYTSSTAYFAGFMSVDGSEYPLPIPPEPSFARHYSRLYDDLDARKQYAMDAYDHGQISIDTVPSVDFYLGDETGTVVYDSTNDPVLTNRRTTYLPLP